MKIWKTEMDYRRKQLIAIMHAGASCALVEIVGNTAGNLYLDLNRH